MGSLFPHTFGSKTFKRVIVLVVFLLLATLLISGIETIPLTSKIVDIVQINNESNLSNTILSDDIIIKEVTSNEIIVNDNSSESINVIETNITNETDNIPSLDIIDESLTQTNITKTENVTDEPVIEEVSPTFTPKEEIVTGTQGFIPSEDIISTTYIYANGQKIASKDTKNVGQTLYYVLDHLGSIRQVIDSNTNVASWSGSEYAFGEDKDSSGDAPINRFTGKEIDEETGLYYYGARYYSPTLGRFIQADIVRGTLDDPLSLNRYAYVKNNPLKYVDPTGNQGVSFWNAVKAYNNFMQERNKKDAELTKRFQRSIPYLYDSPLLDSLQNVVVAPRDFSIDKPNYQTADAIYVADTLDTTVDTIFVDTTKVSLTDPNLFRLVVGNEGGNAANDQGGVADTTLVNAWNTVVTKSKSGDPLAQTIEGYILVAYPIASGDKKVLGDELISSINELILSGTQIPSWLSDLSNMNKVKKVNKNSIKTIQNAEKAFNK